MNAVGISLLSFAALTASYFIYGKLLAKRIFRLDASVKTPAHLLEDGVDFVPTKVPVLFGHHFASIAGLGPILGPALAVFWGWLPAVLWVVFGCIFIGAVHDLGALTVSLKFKGRSIGDVSRELIGSRARLLFLLIIFFLMSLAMGAFVVSISLLFVFYRPDAIIPSFGLMVVAMVMGIAVYKLKYGLGPSTIAGLAAFAGLILLGVEIPLPTHDLFLSETTQQALAPGYVADPVTGMAPISAPYGSKSSIAYLDSQKLEAARLEVVAASDSVQKWWIGLLLAYGFAASVLPVWLLLQPRDYINSFQRYAALSMLVIGLAIASVTGHEIATIHADAIIPTEKTGAPPVFPFLFVTIACGAVSGFHSLVSSGTTVRQLDKETDALPIGFGAMLTEGALAILIIMACVAGLGASAWNSDAGAYSSWGKMQKGGLATQLDAVIRGGANFLEQMGISEAVAEAFLAVTIVAFALTTLDSATRLLRFNVEEIFRSINLPKLANRYVASTIAVLGIAAVALVPGSNTLWILFGSTNQLLAGLTLLTVSLFLYKLGRPTWFTLIPMVLMLCMTSWAMGLQLYGFLYPATGARNWPLIGVTVVVLVMTAWLIVEAILAFARGRGDFSLDLPAPSEPEDKMEQAAGSTHLG